MVNYSIAGIPTRGIDILDWATVRALLEDAIADTSRVAAWTWADGPNASGTPYQWGLNLPDGRAMMLPRTGARIDYFNPTTNLIENGPTHGQATATYIRGVLQPDDTVLCVPDRALAFGLVTLAAGAAGTFAAIYTHGLAGANPYYGGACLGLDGVTYIGPGLGQTNITLYDYRTGLVTEGPAWPGGAPVAAVTCVRPLPSGEIWFSGNSTIGTPQIYDTVAGTFRQPVLPQTFTASAPSANGRETFTADGRLVTAIAGTGMQYVYVPRENQWARAFTMTGVNGNMHGCTLVQDGSLVVCPNNASVIYGVDPASMYWRVVNTPGTLGGSTNFRSSLTLLDGRVLFLPQTYTKLGLLTPYTGGTGIPAQVMMSRWFN